MQCALTVRVNSLIDLHLFCGDTLIAAYKYMHDDVIDESHVSPETCSFNRSDQVPPDEFAVHVRNAHTNTRPVLPPTDFWRPSFRENFVPQ
jgi:hypothetical protein